MIKANTIEQFKVLEYIQKNFQIDKITITILDNTTLKVTDANNESLKFKWNGETVISEEDKL